MPDMLLPERRLLPLGSSFIEKTAVYMNVKETGNVIWEVLHTQFHPQGKEIARVYFDRCSVPNYIGSVDGKHCRMKCPSSAGSLFHNYKGYHFTVLMTIADAR